MGEQPTIAKTFNDMEKSLDSSFFSAIRAMMLSMQTRHPELSDNPDTFGYLLGGLTFVYDANVVQRILRRELKQKLPHGVMEAVKSGFISPIAPRELDDEIAEHTGDIAKKCGLAPLDVLKHYLKEIRPHLKLVNVENMAVMNDVKATIRDIDDAPYITVYFERKAIGVVSEDNDVKDYLGEKAYSVRDICDVNILYRKQYVVMNISIINLVLFLGLVGFMISMLAKMWRFIAGTALAVAVILLIMRLFAKEKFDEIWKGICEQAGDLKKGFLEFWKAVSPFLIEYLEEFAKQNTEFHEKVEMLTKDGKQGLSRTDKLESLPLTYGGLIKMIFLTMKNQPMREKELCNIFNQLGYSSVKGNNIRTGIRRVLKTNSSFMRQKDGRYVMEEQTPQSITSVPLLTQSS